MATESSPWLMAAMQSRDKVPIKRASSPFKPKPAMDLLELFPGRSSHLRSLSSSLASRPRRSTTVSKGSGMEFWDCTALCWVLLLCTSKPRFVGFELLSSQSQMLAKTGPDWQCKTRSQCSRKSFVRRSENTKNTEPQKHWPYNPHVSRSWALSPFRVRSCPHERPSRPTCSANVCQRCMMLYCMGCLFPFNLAGWTANCFAKNRGCWSFDSATGCKMKMPY